MDTVTRFSFPVHSFRNLETPFEKQGYRDYFAVVNVKDLPDLEDWRDINVRDPRLVGAVPQAIRSSVHDNPELFMFMNRGIVLSVEGVSFDNKTSKLTVSFRDKKLHGLLDGGHTYTIIRQECENLEHPQFVRIEMLEGFGQSDIADVVYARNKSNMVRDESLMELRGHFEELKAALAGAPYADKISYSEYETDDEGLPKPIDIRDIVGILTAFDRDHFNARTHPVNAYSSKAACLKLFRENIESYKKIFPLAKDLLELYDRIQVAIPEHYNDDGGKFGNLTGVTTYKDGQRKPRLAFTGRETKWSVPEGFVYPALAAFRALLEEKSKRYVWGKELNPFELLDGELGKQLADTIGNFALEMRNPSKTGKSTAVWQACYSLGEIAYLRA